MKTLMRPHHPVDDLVRLGGSAPTPNQSYLAKQMQRQVAAYLSSLFYELNNGAPATLSPNNATHQPVDWRIGNMIFHFRSAVHDVPSDAWIKFSNARWDPLHGNVNYGPRRVAQNVKVDNSGKTKLIQNKSDVPVHVKYSESESLTDSFSSSVTEGMTLDLTVSSETTISGSYAGVTAEEKITAEFGVSKSHEETHEKSEEGTHEEALEIEFDATPGEFYLVTVSKERQTMYEPFRIDGVLDFDIQLHWDSHGGGARRKFRPAGDVHLHGMDGLVQFVRGWDTRYPEMQGWWGRRLVRHEERHQPGSGSRTPARPGRGHEPTEP